MKKKIFAQDFFCRADFTPFMMGVGGGWLRNIGVVCLNFALSASLLKDYIL